MNKLHRISVPYPIFIPELFIIIKNEIKLIIHQQMAA